MQKMILVKTPLTTNGSDPVLQDGKQVFTESILTEHARKTLEKRNMSLPQHLKVTIEDYAGDAGVTADADKVAVPLSKTKTVQNATA